MRFLTILLVVLCAAETGKSQVLYVDDTSIGPVHDGSSWCSGFRNLQDALEVAHASEGTITEIRIAAGTYRPDIGINMNLGDREAVFELPSDFTLAGGYAGCNAFDPDERNPTAYETILSGDLNGDDKPVPVHYLLTEETRSDNSYLLLDGQRSELSGLTIAGGNGVGPSPFQNRAGGMIVRSGATVLRNCRFERNAALWGGAFFLYGTTDCTFTQCVFADNLARSGAACLGSIGGDEIDIKNSVLIGNVGGVSGISTSEGYTGTAFKISNSILWNNFPQHFERLGAIITNSLVQGGFSGDGTGTVDTDPMFVDMKNGDFRLLADSPCIDAGDNASVPVDLTSDITANPRFIDSSCDGSQNADPQIDIGVFEFQPETTCGDGVCSADESCQTCSCDCGPCCGNGECSDFESPKFCPQDCSREDLMVPSNYATIQSAVEAARHGDRVLVFPGNYEDHIWTGGKEIDIVGVGGAEATTVVPTLNNPILSINLPEGYQATISGFTFTGGQYCYPDCVRPDGRAIQIFGGATIRNCRIVDNLYGGMRIKNGSAFIDSCYFAGNIDSWRSAVEVISEPTVTFMDCQFEHHPNRAIGAEGNVFFGNCRFEMNEGAFQGDEVVAHFNHCQFIRNHTPHSGGAIDSYGPCQYWLNHCVFFGNSAEDEGGAIDHGSVYADNCLFVGNTAEESSALRTSNSSLSNCSVTHNLSDEWYAIRMGQDSPVQNSIIWHNTPVSIITGPNFWYSNIDHTVEGDGEGNISTQPAFVREPSPGEDGCWGTIDDDYGDLRLRTGSVGIDQGNPDTSPKTDEYDMNGNPRMQCNHIDMGAYEFSGDADCNGQLNLLDWSRFQLCYTAESNAIDQACETYDLDRDQDIDLTDLNQWILIATP